MKYLFILSLLISLKSYSQDCQGVSSKLDKFTNKESISFDSVFVIGGPDNALMITATTSGKARYLMFASPNLNCVDSDDYMYIVFTDKSTLKMMNAGDFNCRGVFYINLRYTVLGEQSRSNLFIKQIESVRLEGMSTRKDFEIDDETGIKLLSLLKCFNDKTR